MLFEHKLHVSFLVPSRKKSFIHKLTAALLNSVWVPETYRSFHYWQPAPTCRWRLLPWLANPAIPAMSSHTVRGDRHLSHWKTVGKRREGVGREPPGRTPQSKACGISMYAYVSRPLTTTECKHVLFVANSIKLHFIGLNQHLLCSYCICWCLVLSCTV